MIVSVVIPTYNGERFLYEALQSVLSQTYKDVEVIVVDDGSESETCKNICERFGESVKYIRQENSGVSVARNNGIINSSGELVAFLDDDDVWLPEKIEKQVDLYLKTKRKGRKVGLIYTGYFSVTEEGQEINSVIHKASGSVFDEILITDFITLPSSVLISRDVINDIGFFDAELRCSQDYEYWIRIAQKYEIFYVDQCLVKYRQVVNSLSSNVELKVNLILRNLLPKVQRLIEGRDSDFQQKVKDSFVKECANRYKQHGYLNLYHGKKGAVFREYIRKADALDKGSISIKDWLFFCVSMMSTSLIFFVRSRISKSNSNISRVIGDD